MAGLNTRDRSKLVVCLLECDHISYLEDICQRILSQAEKPNEDTRNVENPSKRSVESLTTL